MIVLRGPEALADEQADQTLEARVALRRVVDIARRHLRGSECSPLIGMRHGEVVALCPVEQPGAADGDPRPAPRRSRRRWSRATPASASATARRSRASPPSYTEARDAAEIAVGIGVRGRPVHFDEVLIDHMVRSTPHADRILERDAEPAARIRRGQAARSSCRRCAPTSTCGFNLTRSAELLQVHPNTVVYRLRRIRELSGRDPHDPDDLLLLFLGLKLVELRAP